MRVLVRCAALLVAVASPVAAQSPIGVGTSAGVVKLTDQRSEEALSGVLEYQPNPWLTLYAIPAVLHLSDNVNGRPVSSSGLGDLPRVVCVPHAGVADRGRRAPGRVADRQRGVRPREWSNRRGIELGRRDLAPAGSPGA